MSLTWLIYLASLSDGICCALLFFICVIIVNICVFGFKIMDERNNYREDEEVLQENKLKIKKSIRVLLILSILCAAIPSEKSIWLMIGSSAIGKTGIPEKIVDVINLKLDEILKKEKCDGKTK